jgi:hypothetical protein
MRNRHAKTQTEPERCDLLSAKAAVLAITDILFRKQNKMHRISCNLSSFRSAPIDDPYVQDWKPASGGDGWLCGGGSTKRVEPCQEEIRTRKQRVHEMDKL